MYEVYIYEMKFLLEYVQYEKCMFHDSSFCNVYIIL